MKGKSLIIIGFLVLSRGVYAQPVWIENGFLTGEQYLRLEQRARNTYVMGLIDGIFLAPLFGGSEQRTRNLGTCVEGMTNSQLDAILSKYLNENPSRWHEPVHRSMYTALLAVCPGFKA